MKELKKESPNSSANKTLKLNLVQRFFLFCAGANLDIIKTCPEEVNKYVAVGATVFITAILASLSGGYAFNFTFKNLETAIGFGIFWGILIFNLDRFIVMSLKKPHSEKISTIIKETNPLKRRGMILDKITNSFNLFFLALPRFIIAIIIGLTISKPLELKLFETTVNKELQETLKDEMNAFEKGHQQTIDSLNQKIVSLNKEEIDEKNSIYNNNGIYQDQKLSLSKKDSVINKIEDKISNNNSIISKSYYTKTTYITETTTNENGEEITRQIPKTTRYLNAIGQQKRSENKGLNEKLKTLKGEKSDVKESIKDEIETITGGVKQIEIRYDSLRSNINKIISFEKNNYNKNYDKNKSILEANRDILARLLALENAKKGKSEGEQNIAYWVSLLITFLFLALETAPIVVKLLLPRGPYEELDDGKKHKYFIESQKEISIRNSKANNALDEVEEIEKMKKQFNIDIKKKDLDREMEAKDQVFDKILEKQEKLAEIQIQNWYDEELNKLKNNQP